MPVGDRLSIGMKMDWTCFHYEKRSMRAPGYSSLLFMYSQHFPTKHPTHIIANSPPQKTVQQLLGISRRRRRKRYLGFALITKRKTKKNSHLYQASNVEESNEKDIIDFSKLRILGKPTILSQGGVGCVASRLESFWFDLSILLALIIWKLIIKIYTYPKGKDFSFIHHSVA